MTAREDTRRFFPEWVVTKSPNAAKKCEFGRETQEFLHPNFPAGGEKMI
jgi:hypothetical protein